MTTFERVKELADSQKISLQELANRLGFSENLIYRWKNATPKTEYLEKVADYFDVTVDYLLGRENSANNSKPVIDLAELANMPKDFDWSKFVSAGGKPLSERDKALIRTLFADELNDIDE